LQPGAIDPLFNGANNTFNFVADQGGLDVVDEDLLLFYIEMEAATQAGTSMIELSDDPVQLEMSGVIGNLPVLLNPQLIHGRITVMSSAVTADIGATVETFWGEGVEGAVLNVVNQSTSESLQLATSSSGEVAIDNATMGDMFYLDVERAGEYDNGLSTFGLFLGQRYLLELPTPQIASPYQIIAADANCDDNFSVLDLFLIQAVILGDLQELPGCPSWVFVHESSQMPDDWNAQNIFPYENHTSIMLEGDTTTNFVGVKVGDILGEASADQMWEQASEERGLGEMRLELNAPDRVAAGQTFSIYLRSDDFVRLGSLQFGLNFDSGRAAFIQARSPLDQARIGLSHLERGELRFSWFAGRGEGESHAGDWLEIQFVATEDLVNPANLLALNSQAFRNEAYTANGDPLLIGWQTPELVYDEFAVSQNAPNPFEQTTFIEVTLPHDGELNLVVIDQLGRQLLSRRQNYTAGKHRLTLDLTQLPAGQYYYRTTFGQQSVVKTMSIRR
ncbi:MAG: T9SS type A sorting domain-containing protein, partial [Bacteroidota bacterium]